MGVAAETTPSPSPSPPRLRRSRPGSRTGHKPPSFGDGELVLGAGASDTQRLRKRSADIAGRDPHAVLAGADDAVAGTEVRAAGTTLVPVQDRERIAASRVPNADRPIVTGANDAIPTVIELGRVDRTLMSGEDHWVAIRPRPDTNHAVAACCGDPLPAIAVGDAADNTVVWQPSLRLALALPIAGVPHPCGSIV